MRKEPEDTSPTISSIADQINSKRTVLKDKELSSDDIVNFSRLLSESAERGEFSGGITPLHLTGIRTIFHAMSTDLVIRRIKARLKQEKKPDLNFSWVFGIFLGVSELKFSPENASALAVSIGNISFSLSKLLKNGILNLSQFPGGSEKIFPAFDKLGNELLSCLRKINNNPDSVKSSSQGLFSLLTELWSVDLNRVNEKIILGLLELIKSKGLTEDVTLYSTVYSKYLKPTSENPVAALSHDQADSSEIERLRNELRGAQKDLGAAREEIGKLKAEAAAELGKGSQKTILQQQEEIERLKAEMEKLKAEIKQFSIDTSQTISRQHQAALEHDERMRDQQKEIENLKATALAVIPQKQETIQELERRLAEESSKSLDLMRQCGELRYYTDQLREGIRRDRLQMAQLNAQKVQLETCLSAANQRINQLAGDLQAAQERHLQVLEAALVVPSQMQNRHSQAAPPAPSGGFHGQRLWWERDPPGYQGRGQRRDRYNPS